MSRLLCLLLVCMDLTWIESLRSAVAVARRAPPWHLLRLPAPSIVSQGGVKDQGVESGTLVMTGLDKGDSCHF